MRKRIVSKCLEFIREIEFYLKDNEKIIPLLNYIKTSLKIELEKNYFRKESISLSKKMKGGLKNININKNEKS